MIEMPAPWGQIGKPKFCGTCGKAMVEQSVTGYDRQTGAELEQQVVRVQCPDMHEVFGTNLIGTWRQYFDGEADADAR